MNNNDQEIRIKALENARKEIEDNLVVMAHLETRQSNQLKLQAEATERLRQQAEEQRQLNQETDRRIAELVSAIGKLIGKMPPASQDRP